MKFIDYNPSSVTLMKEINHVELSIVAKLFNGIVPDSAVSKGDSGYLLVLASQTSLSIFQEINVVTSETTNPFSEGYVDNKSFISVLVPYQLNGGTTSNPYSSFASDNDFRTVLCASQGGYLLIARSY